MLQPLTRCRQGEGYLQHMPNYHVDKISLKTRGSWHLELTRPIDLSSFVLKKCKSKAMSVHASIFLQTAYRNLQSVFSTQASFFTELI